MNKAPLAGIDCDVHPVVPGIAALVPYLDGHWADAVVQRGLHDLEPTSYPLNAPLTARPEWRPGACKAGGDRGLLCKHVLDEFGSRIAILNCLYAVQTLFSEDMGAALARAVNSWLAREWLDHDSRLRASIVVPIQNAEMAAAEIDRCAADRRFVQVLLPCLSDQPLGRRLHWPIYEAAQRHGLPVAIHAGSTYRHPVTPVGWPSTFTEDYVAQAQGFQTQLTSLVCEGVLSRFPDLTFVFAESGFTWLPSYLWRLTKYWHGLRMEIPWVDQPPADLIRRQVRFTLQPVDAPTDSDDILRVIDHVGSEELLLFSTDYPHWQFDGDDPFPASFPAALRQKLLLDNPLRTYARIREGFA